MKKAKKLLAGLAFAAMLLTTGCNSNANPDGIPSRKQDVYQLYKKDGGKMTYQEWLATVSGKDGSQLYADAGVPTTDLVNEGDYYIDLETWYLYIRENGAWVKLFCMQGPQGEQGLQGPKGDQGDQGPKGDAGSQIYADAEVPANTAGKDGDIFVDLTNFDFYMKIEGAWQRIGNIKGKDGVDGVNGTDGAAFYCDAGDPAASAGKNGDVYVNIETYDIFTKLDGEWKNFGNIKGAQGAPGEKGEQGTSFRAGWGAPAASLGNEGDSYMNYSNGDIYLKLGGHWQKEQNFNNGLSWKDDVAKKMMRYFGFQLPYADFDQSSLIFTLTFEGYYEYLTIYDTNDYNVLSNYGEKLLANGYTYSSYYDQYYKSVATGFKTPWVDQFGYDAENRANYLRVEFSPYQDEYYFYNNSDTYSRITEWPAEKVAQAMGDDFAAVVTGVDFQGYAFDSFKVQNEGDEYDEYSQELIAIEGDYVDELKEQVAAAGFIWDDYEEEFFDENGDAEVSIVLKDGYTRVGLYGTYAKDWDDAYLAANLDEFENGWADIQEKFEIIYPDSQPAGVNTSGKWFGYFEESYWGGTDGLLATTGDYVDEFIQNLIDAEFYFDDYYEDYEYDWYKYFTVSYRRGVTLINLSSDIEVPKTAKDMSEWVSEAAAYYFDMDGVVIPEFASANGEYIFTDYYAEDYGVLLCEVDYATEDELTAYLALLDEAGWSANAPQYNVEGGAVSRRLGNEGEVLAVDMWYEVAEDNDGNEIPLVALYFYEAFVMGEITPLNVIANIANMIGGDVEDLGDGEYGVEGSYYASSTPVEKIMGWCESSFTPASFEMVVEWTEDELSDGTPCYKCAFADFEAGVVIEYTVFSDEYQGTAITTFFAIAYEYDFNA